MASPNFPAFPYDAYVNFERQMAKVLAKPKQAWHTATNRLNDM
jgi:hypothetical protein